MTRKWQVNHSPNKDMKKTLTIIIIIFLLLLAGIGAFLYINSGNQNINSQTIFDNVKNFFPFGNTTTTDSTSTKSEQTNPGIKNDNKPVVERFFQISNTPTSGYIAIDVVSTSTKLSFGSTTVATSTKKGSAASTTKEINTFVRFVDRATGHIYESKIPTLEKTRLSNTTLPKVYDAVFNSKGTEVVMRFLNGENISTVYNKILTGTSTATTSTNLLYPSNTDIFISNKDSVFYTVRGSESSTGYLSTFDRKKSTQVFTTELRDILAVSSGGDNVALFSKPHSDYPGVLFLVNTKTGKSQQVLSGINGLTGLPNIDASYVLFNTNSKDLSLAAQKISSNIPFNLAPKTLPEKCVWSKIHKTLLYCAIPTLIPDGGYPEKWYQGSVSFVDNIWSMDVETGDQRLIYSPLDSGKPSQDATNLTLNDKENYLFFINKKDLTLWGLFLEQ